MDNATTPSVITLKTLRASFALLMGACMLAAAMVVATLHFHEQAKRDNQQALILQAETRMRLARVHDDEREIRDKIARFQEILRLGRTQPERRLEWVETLRNIKNNRRLLGLDYEISPQRALDEKNPTSGGYRFLSSPMKLDMPLLHENDLLGLFSDLSAQVQALVCIRSCKIDRLLPDSAGQNPATLKAACEIDWITLQQESR